MTSTANARTRGACRCVGTIAVVGLFAWCCLALAAPQYPSIVVNIGKYPGAKQAAFDEEHVNWFDTDESDDTVCTECFAAVQLRHYLCLMFGADESSRESFPIVDDDAFTGGDAIIVGGPRSNSYARRLANELGLTEESLASLGEQGYRVLGKEVGGDRILVVAGGSRVGTLYGVYGLLQRLGVRWFGPGELNEEVPRRTYAGLPVLDVAERPGFLSRGFWAWESRGTPQFFLWMARNRMNFWCVDRPHVALLKKLGIHMTCGGHQHQSRFLNPHSPYPYDHPRFSGDERNPPDPYPISPQFAGDKNGDGVLSYCEAHPEWYCLRGGKRSFNIRGAFGDNFCTSNPHAVAEFMKNIIHDLAAGEWKYADSINFWMLDWGHWCECESCRALGTPTDRYLLLVHRLRQEIVRARRAGALNRDVKVIFLAYAELISPPTRPLPEDFDYDNCIVTFFPIRRCYVHPFNSRKCTEYNLRYAQQYARWATDPKRYYKGKIFIGEYYNVSRYKCLPIVYHNIMAQDIPYYYNTGARHMHYMHVTTDKWGTKCLTNWQFAQMLWNPHIDAQALLSDYLLHRYGPAADRMREFYGHLEKALCNVTELKYVLAPRLARNDAVLFPHKHLKYLATHWDTDDGPDLVETVQEIALCRKIIDEVKQMPLPERVAARVAEDERVFRYAENTIHLFDHVVQAVHALREGNETLAREQYNLAARYGQMLREDKECARYSSSHANAADGLEASLIGAALSRLAKKFGPGPAPGDPGR